MSMGLHGLLPLSHLQSQHLAYALLEYIRWIHDGLETPAHTEDGFYVAPDAAVAGITPFQLMVELPWDFNYD